MHVRSTYAGRRSSQSVHAYLWVSLLRFEALYKKLDAKGGKDEGHMLPNYMQGNYH